MKPRRIAVLFHRDQTPQRAAHTLVMHYAGVWKEDGHEILPLYGTRRFVPADILLVHVDLSDVPEEYLAFARRYRIALNLRASSIRKHAGSDLAYRPGMDWNGPVIVKSALNSAGVPEWELKENTPWRRLWRALTRESRSQYIARREAAAFPYQIYPHPGAVPPDLASRPDLVRERFLPEREDGLHFIRYHIFMGSRSSTARCGSPEPIVKWRNITRREWLPEPHPDMVALQHRLGLDFGKFDYVVHDGKAHVFDINKTPASSGKVQPDEATLRARRHRAQGLYDFFKD